MQPDERDAAYLWDMIEAARTVRDFTSGLTFDIYEKDKKLRLAVERAIEIIGEAAARVSKGFQDDHPEISWKGIIGQRNVLIHEYGEIRHERLWAVATQRIPELLRILDPLIPAPPKGEL
ncbi:MAG TPA: DUF86 domain-containing protein [Dissulfurispiraceae bacterium]|nr:DUF86 domain-containing protein [Dissulfurispiraceae bacterium]